MKIYDTEQIRAIESTKGYYLVLAPPGCGKTDILSERIVYANEHGVPFEDMLCLTFTNRASKGMLDRIRQKVGEDSRDIFVGNVHRFCSRFLFDNSLVPENSAIIDDDDAADILMSFDADFFFNHRQGVIDKTKVSLVDNIDAYILQRKFNQPSSSIFLPEKEFEKYYKAAEKVNFDETKLHNTDDFVVSYALQYRKYKDARNIISFSDTIILAYEALRNDTEKNFKRYSWIQIDEVQDLNGLQIAIVDELLDTSKNFTVMYLGDEQQAIFSFLGAKLGQLQLLRQRCGSNILSLSTNYRSPKYLLDIFNTYAREILHVDASLLPKPNNDTLHDKFDLILTGNPSTGEEDKRVLKMIDYYLRFDDDRVAILVPTNKAADRISDSLSLNGIPHFKISGTDMFRTKSYKTLSAFFSVNANDFNAMSWSRLLHGIGAIKTGASAREFIMRLKELMMTPSDLLQDKSYIEQFNEEYMSREFVFFDTETTGLNVLEDEIVQIAAFKVFKGQRVEGSDFNIFLHTERPLPDKVGGKTNPLIGAYAINNHYSREEGLRMFLDYVGDCPLLGHNVNYDYRILKSNVEQSLRETVSFDIYDSLHLIKCVEPNLHMYKLEYLLTKLQLEGKNSHLADEDVAATKALVDYCYQKSLQTISLQHQFLLKSKVKNVVAKLRLLVSLFDNIKDNLYIPVSTTGRTIADEMRSVYDEMLSLGIIDNLGDKFDVFLQFVQQEWVDLEKEETIFDQIASHITDMTASINEGDLVNSEGLISDRVFVMTVHKGKGLEFENVVVLEANDGTYPFFTVNNVLNNTYARPDDVAKAKQERMEDARKFYVALSRAKKRLCVSYTHRNSYGYLTSMTPFVKPIEHFFTK